LHKKLKEEAARHHRSMTRQALVLIEQARLFPASGELRLPAPVKPLKPVNARKVVGMIREARDQVDAVLFPDSSARAKRRKG
jgi:hypothetical protein